MLDESGPRFWSKVDKNGPLPDETDPFVTAPLTPCWLWTRGKHRGGYGRFKFENREYCATHVAWYLSHGTLPENCIDHLCRRPSCVNPEHLEDVTNRENVLRGKSGLGIPKDWKTGSRRKPGPKKGTPGVRRTICSKGHPLTEDNRSPINGRCLICKKRTDKECRLRKRLKETGV